jgi:colanic acid biosynthesis glycosyl transferase WcaI
VPNWIHSEFSIRLEHAKSIIDRREDRVLFYSGNFGVKQGLPDFLRDFSEVRGLWRLQLNGGGAESESLVEAASGCGDWLKFGGLLNDADYACALLRATACVVTQRRGVGANFLPSKLLPALAAGTPILAVCDADTPLGEAVVDGQYGEVVAPGDTAALAVTLHRWRTYPELLKQYGINAARSSSRFSRSIICGEYERILSELVESRRSYVQTQ